ncbi:MAG: outer membrane porin, OprD family [Candidatus Eremiobacteraeota bacterium]|nr:outer membrane porin, OprD family [Candidatus Eremiobacteraeota bacterium]MBC5803700.1 outer membrane porin, OprD family [Candidatus Eremiobacteraeota bacterium]MBC5823077.1 outer membrane porin, OprD family [Candidatus Eremiobacteraeota bacterium]
MTVAVLLLALTGPDVVAHAAPPPPETARPAAPAPTSTPRVLSPVPGVAGLEFGGQLRAYEFDRENGVQNVSNPNRSAFNVGGFLHLDYDIARSPLHIATSYFGAYPFGANGPKAQYNAGVDNTVPGFALSTFDEAYLRYRDAHTNATLGDQIINTPWALAADTRLKAAAFEGLDVNYTLGSHLTLGVSRMIRFEGRTSSLFERNTLLTSSPAGGTAYKAHDTSGFLLADITYRSSAVTATADDYRFYDIANLFYAEARASLAPMSPYHPAAAVQYVNEHSTGRAVVGRVVNETYGLQLSANLNRNVLFAFGLDTAPMHYETTTATSAAVVGKGVFLPAGGTTASVALGGGRYRVAFGGIASPYTESYTADPLYTTSISQGMVERQSPGTAYKASLTFMPDNKRVRGILSEAFYDYGNQLGSNRTYETDVDVTYYFSPVATTPYKGVSFRERFANRQQPTLPYDFKYIRTQLQYDF